MAMEPDVPRHTCLKLHLGDGDGTAVVFIKGTWFASNFQLSITDGLDAWICNATEIDVRQRAEQWDQPVSEYISMAERYLGFQQPGYIYRFEEAGNGQRRLSWTFEKLGTKLEWRWKCQPSLNSKQTTTEILDFLMEANIRLSVYLKILTPSAIPEIYVCWVTVQPLASVTKEEVVSIRQLFEKMKSEAEKCLVQSEKFCNEKVEFESAVYGKFVAVLNSKKAKLRELRDSLSKSHNADKALRDEDGSSDKTGTFDEGSADEVSK